MASQPPSTDTNSYATPNRLWAEQLAAGLALFIGILIFMALFHPTMLSSGAKVLGPNDLDAYGWVSIVGIFLQVLIHELGTILVAWRMKLVLRFRIFGFGPMPPRSLKTNRAVRGQMPWSAWPARSQAPCFPGFSQ